ncbi:hypothetical protein HNQ02_003875 [Flavobacterium sp. 7E]|jgi:hypothetical protein|uniref:hypothetical protein n=1 Tax=Flavobacterium sp. 7E TaxID=2735898 RepID=UPI001570B8D0|nr:hypothetical protein [Flavobacterium sp. 7E]NRS90920.1 hypothetical protein [Flavobacterium sp. 7E]
MKTELRLITTLIAFVFLGCNKNQETNKVPENINFPIIGKPIIQPTKKNENKIVNIEQLKQIVPIDTVNTKSTNVYEKYGIEFTGNCYACDLAEISITEKTIKLTNICDEKENKNIEIIEIVNNKDKINIKTKHSNFIFSKIDTAPIYELQIIGENIEFKNLRISKYYTLKKILNKFKEHDCGDFQG